MQIVGKQGGKASFLKFDGNYDYYRFNYVKDGYGGVNTILFQDAGLSFNHLFRIASTDLEIEGVVYLRAFLNPGGAPFTFNCGHNNIAKFDGWNNTVNEFTVTGNCPVSCDSDETKESNILGSYFKFQTQAFKTPSISFKGGSSYRGFSHQKGGGIFRITKDCVVDATVSGERHFESVMLKKLN